jgi:hypothetical protein
MLSINLLRRFVFAEKKPGGLTAGLSFASGDAA